MAIIQEVVDRIIELLAEDELSQREIALVIGVSRGTVNSIASGKRGRYTKCYSNEDEELHDELGKCPACGRQVYFPCKACAMSNKDKSIPSRTEANEELRHELFPSQERAMLQVKKKQLELLAQSGRRVKTRKKKNVPLEEVFFVKEKQRFK